MNESSKSLVVVIPALDEEESIAAVIKSILKYNFDVIVIDDGSSDNTGEIAKHLGVCVIRHESPQGYEAALSAGIDMACKRCYDYVATFDADNQFNISDLVFFWSVVCKQHLDLLVGIRDVYNRKSEKLVARLGRKALGLSDLLCGLKMYRINAINKFLPFDQYKLAGTELAIKLILSGASFSEHKVRINERLSVSRYGSSIKGELKILNVFIKQIFLLLIWKKKLLPSFRHA